MKPLKTGGAKTLSTGCLISASALSLAALLPLHGEGFRNPPAGAFSLARAGGRVAQIDDPSAVVQNPANMLDLDSPAFSVTPGFVYIHIERESATGKDETKDPWKTLPAFFVTTPLIKDKLAAGFGVTTPYGLSNEWSQNGSFADVGNPFSLRYTTPWFTELKTINANPGVSYHLADGLNVGVGMSFFWSQLTFRRYLATQFAGLPSESSLVARGDGTGFGGNAGITWEFTKGQRVAVTYRSPVQVDYGGSTFTQISSGGSPRNTSDFSTKIKYPTIIGAGYGIELTEKIRVEVGFEWIQFSNFKSLDVKVGANPPIFPADTIVSAPENWKDTMTFGLGGDWKITDQLTARASYQFYQSPVPDSTFSPTIPDANQNVFTVGLQYRKGHHSFEGAYGGIFYEDRHIANGGPYDGVYSFNVHLFALAYNYSF